MFRENIIAAIRTASAVLGPAILTGIVAFAARLNIDIQIDSEVGIALAGLVYGVIVGVWNYTANWLTVNVSHKFAWVLLIPKLPSYAGPTLHKSDHPVEEDYGFGGGENG